MTILESAGATAAPRHAVQFYEREEFLYDVVADFLAAGLDVGEPAIVICTPEHRQAFTSRLRERGTPIERLKFLDAREMLSTFMVGGAPDPARFHESVGRVVKATAAQSTSLRAYGEMVDVLWRNGETDAALRLEELWNELAEQCSFSLLCAYRMGSFLRDICVRHDHVHDSEEVKKRKEIEMALREALAARRAAEEELKDFIQHATVGMHCVGPDGTILWANDAELQLLGYSADEYIGRSIADFHADRPVIEDILRRLGAREQIRDYEARLIAKDGSIRHVAISSNAKFENDRFVHTRCFTRDITDSKRLEEERRRTQEANEFLLETTTILHGSLDYEARLREATNLAVPRLADWCALDLASEDGTYERAGLAHFDPERLEKARQILRAYPLPRRRDPIDEVLRSGEPVIVQLTDDYLASVAVDETHLREAKSLGLCSMMIVPMLHNDRVLGAISFITGVSGRRYTTGDLPLAMEFARRAAIAIDNARLYQLARDANRTKDEFLATLSHELRTPLTAILGWARMLTLGSLDADTMHIALETIERSARTQAALIDDLLDLSKIVTGKLTLRSDPVDLIASVEGAVQTLQLAADAKGITLEVAMPRERTVVTGDATRLQQIVWNLLSNAIKFSESGGRVSLSMTRDTEAAHIVVSDDGRGISAEFLPHVFEAFRQADGATTRKHGGLGLGLAVVKYLTELHGGTVVATSDGEGMGATFIVTLPLALRRTVAAEPVKDTVDLHGTSVLVVDDDLDSRELVTAILRRFGAEVQCVDSVRGACDVLSGHAPHVIVSDIAMPVEDGVALLQHVPAEMPVVALTAVADADASDRLHAAGFRAYVRKPVDPVQFARVIADLR